MTRRYEVTPSPSHPRRRLIIFGLKMSKNIDLIKDITSIKNRPKNFSGLM